MPIDVDKVLGAQLGSGVAEWDEDKVILYHVGVGAGVPPTDEKELEYTYEARLKVLPSFGVIPVFSTLGGLIGVEGLSFNPMMLLHGEQDITLHQPLPTRAKVENSGKVVGVYDKVKGATIVVATHDLNLINRYGTRVILLQRGALTDDLKLASWQENGK